MLRRLLSTALLGALGADVQATNYIRQNNATTLDLAGAWSAGGPPLLGDVAQWSSTCSTAANCVIGPASGVSLNWAGISASSSPAATVVIPAAGSAALTLGASGISWTSSTSSRGLTITLPLTIGASQTWTATGTQTLTANGASMTLTSGTLLTLSGISTTTFTLSAPITGSGGISKTGSGLVTLSGSNTGYSGLTTVGAGTLRLNNATPLGSSPANLAVSGGVLEGTTSYPSFTQALGTGAGQLQITGGASGFSAFGAPVSVNLSSGGALTWGMAGFAPTTLILNGSLATSTLDFQNALELNSASVRTIQTDANVATISGVVSNSNGTPGGLTKTGAGTLVLSNAGNSAVGPVAISAGYLRAGSDGAGILSGNPGVAITGSGVWGLGGSFARTIQTAASPAASCVQLNGTSVGFDAVGSPLALSFGGPDPLVWGSDFIASTALMLNSVGANSTLSLANNINLGAAARAINVGASASNTATLSGVLSGVAAGTLTKQGAGTLVLSGASTYAGKTILSAGVLSVGSLNKVSGGSANSNLGAPGNAIDGTISMGSGSTGASLVYTGAGETTDRVINLASSTGGLVIDHSGAGLLKFTADQTAAASSKTLTLQGSTAGVGEYAGKIVNGSSGAVALTKAGTNVWTLSNANTYSGTTTISAGTLVAANNGALGTGPVSLGAATLDLAMDGTPTTATNVTASATGSKILLNKATAASAGDTKTVNALSVSGVAMSIDKGANVSGGTPTLAVGSVLTVTGTSSINVTNGVALNVLGVVTNGSTTARTLTFLGDGSVALANTVMNGASALSLTFNGPTATIAGTNVNTGTTTISAGSVNLTGALGNGAVALSGGALSLQSSEGIRQNTLTLTGTGNLTQTAVNGLSGTAALTVNSATCAATLSQANNHTGATTLTLGTLTLSDFGAVGSSGLKLGGSTLSLRGDSAGTFLSASNTVTASTVIDVGPVSSGSGNALSLGAINLGAVILGSTGGSGYSLGLGAATLTGAATFNPTTASMTVASVTGVNQNLTLGGTAVDNSCGPITTGTGTLTKNTASTWTLSGASTYSGATAVSAGTLNVAGSLGSTVVTLTGTGMLNVPVVNGLTGTAALTVNSATAAATLSQPNDHTGLTTLTTGALTLADFGAVASSGLKLSGGTLLLRNDGAGSFLSASNTITASTVIDVGPASAGSGNTLNLGPTIMAAATLGVSGNSGYSLGLGAVTLTGAAVFNPTNANLNVASVAGPAGLTLGGTTADNTCGPLTMSTGSLTKNTAATWTLTGASTYTNVTTISAGTANLAGTLGNTAVTVSGGTLNLQNAGAISQKTLTVSGTGTLNQTVPNSLSGTAALTVSSATATANLSEANDYTGATAISAGAVNVGGALGNTAIALTGGSLVLQGEGAINQNTLTISGTGRLTETAVNGLSGTAALTVSAAGATGVLSRANSYSGQTTLTAGTLVASDPGALGASTVSLSGGTLDLAMDGTPTTGTSIVLASGSTSKILADKATEGSAGDTKTLGSLSVVGSSTMTFDKGPNVSGGSPTIAFAGPLGFTAGNPTLNIASGVELSLQNIFINVATSSRTLTFGGAGTATVAGAVSNGFATVGLTVNGPSVVLANTNPYGGSTAINAGTLTVNAGGSLSGGGSITVTNGAFRLNGTATGSGAVTVNNGGLLSGTGVIGGTRATTINNGGTVNPGSAGTVGTLTANAATFNSGSMLAIDLGAGVGNADTLVLNAGLTIQPGAQIALSELSAPDQPKYVLMTYTNGYNGGAFTVSGALPSGYTLTYSSTKVELVQTGADMSGVWISPSNGLWSATGNWLVGNVASGSGKEANFNTVNIVTNDTLPDAVTVSLDSARTIGSMIFGDTTNTSAAGWVLDNGGDPANVLTLDDVVPTITVNALGTGKVATGNLTLAGTNGLTKAGAGGLILNGANTYGGVTTVKAGALTLAGDNSAATGGVTLVSGATLNINHPNALGVGPLNINGGTLNNTSSVPVAVATGNEQNWNGNFTFTGANDLDLGTGAVALTTNITMTTVASNLTVNGVISGPWQLTKTGAGKLTLVGANTYTGPTLINGIVGVGILADGGQPSGIGQSDSAASNLWVTGGNATIQYTGGSASSDRSYTVSPTRTLTFEIVEPTTTLTLNGSCYTNANTGTSPLFAKTGPGTLVINGDNQNRGMTYVYNGKLIINGSTAGEGNNVVTGIGGVQVSSNATASGTGMINGTLDINAAGSIVAPGLDGVAGGELTTDYLRLAVGSVSVFEFNATTNDTINVTTNGVWKLFGSTVYLYAEGTTNAWTSNGTYNLIRAQDPLQDGVQYLAIGNPAPGKAYAFSLVDGWVAVTIATGEVWDGGGADDNWGASLNWQSDTVPVAGVGLVFAGASRLTPNNDLAAYTPFGGITFNASAESFVLGGAAINLAGNVLNSSTNAQTINLPLVLEGGSRTFTAAMGDLTVGGVIDDAGAGLGILKSGPYALTLTADNTYLGGTSIAGGTLRFTGALASPTITVNGGGALSGTGVCTGAVTCSNGGTVAPGLGGVAGGVLTVGRLTFAAGSTNAFEFGAAPTNDLIEVTASGGLAINGGGVCLYAEGTTNAWTTDGVYRLIRYSGALAGDVANWSVLNPDSGKTYAFGASGSWILLTISSSANVWDGGGADGLWQTGANWVADVAPVANGGLTFAGVAGLVATNDFPAWTRFGNISFDATAGAFTLEGNDLNLVGNVVNNSSNLQTLNTPLVLDSASRTFNAAANSLAVGGVISDDGQGLGLLKTGANILTLTGNNTYTGITRVNAGKLSVPVLPNGGLVGPLGASSSDPANLVLNGGTLQYTGGTATTDRSFTPLGIGTIEVATLGTTLELSGATPSVPGSLAKTGLGTLKLSGQNQHTGFTRIAQGTLEYGVDDALFTGGQVVLNGAGAVFDLGSHDAHLAVLSVTNGVIAGSGTLTASGAYYFDGALSTTCGVTLAGSAMLVRTNNSSGVITLTGANTYTGPTMIMAAGTLSVGLLANGGDPSGIGASSSDAANWVFGSTSSILRYTGGSVTIDRNYSIVSTKQFGIEVTEPTTTLTLLGGTPVGDGTNKKLGPGTLVLAGANLNTGATTISAGTLQVGNGGTTGTLSTNTIANSAALVFNRSDAYAHAAVISGAGTLTQAGTGLLTLSGTNTFTGRTSINAGTLRINAETGLGANPGALTANQLTLNGGTFEAGASFAIDDANRGISLGSGGGTFRIDTPFTQTVVRVISGSGLLTKTGTGILTLATNDTYTGGTAIAAGTLRLGFANALPYGVGAGNTAIDADGLLDVSAFPATLNGLDGTGTIDKSTNNATALALGANNQSGVFGGVIQNTLGSIRLIKSGTGVQTLSGANTYGGTTTVSNGTLRVNNIAGSGTGYGMVTVYTNAILGGVGAITGAVTVAGGATLAPGDGSGVGALTVNDLTLQNGANYAWSWDYPGTGSNRTVVAGTLVLPTDLRVSVTNRSTNPLPSRSVLFSYAARTGSPSAWQVTGAVSGLKVLDDTANQVILLVNTSSVVTAWPTAAGITYGQTLAAATLGGGTSAVPGAFDYSAPTTAPTAGVYRAMVVFTPTDAATYDVESNLVDVAVAKATPTVTTLPTASGIVYGQTLTASVLTGGACSVAGAFSFTAPATAPAAGVYSAALTFTPTDVANFEVIAAGNVDVAVSVATPTFADLPTATGITYGQTLAASTLVGGVATNVAGSAAVPGLFTFDSPTTAPTAGVHSAAITFTPTDGANYTTAAGFVNVNVAKATPTVTTLPTASGIVYGQTLAASVLTGGAGSVAGAFSFSAPTTTPAAGVYSAGLTFTPTDVANYEVIAAGNVDVAVVPASFGDHVWYDVDSDAVKGAFEPGIGGVRVYVDENSSTTYDVGEPSAITAADGSYSIGGLMVGTYAARVDVSTLPVGLDRTHDLNGALDDAASVVLSSATPRTDVDFGYRSPAAYSVGGQIRDDYDSNGMLSDLELPVGGVLVSLHTDPNGDGDPEDGGVVETQRTTADGRYLFTNVVSGAYVVVETDPTYAVSTGDTGGLGGPTDNRIPVVVSDADSVGNDFLDAVDPAGYLYDVADGRILTGGSVAVSGPGALVLMDGSSGQYMFIATNGAAATYTIAVTPPVGYAIAPAYPAQAGSFDPTGGPTPTALGSAENSANPGYLVNYSAASNTYYYTFELAPGDPPVINNNFPLTRFATVGDSVWSDVDHDGIQDGGETGMVGVVVSAYAISNVLEQVTTNLVASLPTDSAGAFRFETLPAGTYILAVEAPAGYAFSPLHAGGNANADSDFGPNTPYSASFTVAAGAVSQDLDAGLYYAPNLAVITSFRAFERAGAVFVAWEVAAEFDTLGYRIERRVGDAWVSVNPEAPVWSELLPWGPFAYELADPGATPGGTYTWQVVEMEGSGRENVYGPYTVTVGGAAADYAGWAATILWNDAASGPNDDPDGDGLTNDQEFLAGTDPLSRTSTLKILSLARSADGLEIRWPSVDGRVYAVLYARNLGDAWLPVQRGIAATAPENRFVLPGADGGFFRIALEPAPR